MAIVGDRQVQFRHVQIARGGPQDAWIEAQIDDAWMVAYRLVQHEGQPVVGELRIFPRESGNRMPGEWSGTRLGFHAAVPAGGISARLARQVRVGADFSEGLKAGRRYLRLVPDSISRFRAAGFRGLKRQRRPSKGGGRPGWSQDELLDAALFYADRGGSRPVADLAVAWNLKRTQARDLIQAAKEKGFLTAGTRGKTSRALTDVARNLLVERKLQ